MDNQFDILYDERLKINKRRTYYESVYPVTTPSAAAFHMSEQKAIVIFLYKLNRLKRETRAKKRQGRRDRNLIKKRKVIILVIIRLGQTTEIQILYRTLKITIRSKFPCLENPKRN